MNALITYKIRRSLTRKFVQRFQQKFMRGSSLEWCKQLLSKVLLILLLQFRENIGDLVSKDSVCCVGGKVKH